MLLPKPPINIVATILMKDEADIIAHTLEHHINQGVKQFIITDNNSTDGSRQIVEKYPEVVEIIDEPGDDHHQSKWVTHMARLACKLNPDWIVHLDADELWGNLMALREFNTKIVGCTSMFLHPPLPGEFTLENRRWFLDFRGILPGECKVAHRPDTKIVITHGNHGVEGSFTTAFTEEIWRHHYPVRSFEQLSRKATMGHAALTRRGACCERWKIWANLNKWGELKRRYDEICDQWKFMTEASEIHSMTHLVSLLSFWSNPEVVKHFQQTYLVPTIGTWPKSCSPVQ